MLLQQIPDVVEIGNDALNRAWDINPASVFGVLVGLQLIAIVYLAYINSRKDKKLYELTVSSIEVLNDLNTSLLLLKEEGVQLSEKISEQFEFTRGHISQTLQNFKGNGTEKS